METTDPGFYLPTTLLNNLEISVPQTDNSQAQEYLSVLPLSFILNAGQVDPHVRYMVTGHQSTLYFTQNEIVIAEREIQGSQPFMHIIRQTFPGANVNPVIDGENQLAGSANFFYGDDPSKWQTNVSTFGSVIYHDLYPGIDLHYTGKDGTLKREFVVTPGTSPAAIRIHYEGTDSLIVDDTGSLVITAGNSTLTESPILCYQDIPGSRTIISASYQVMGQKDIAFYLGEYNPLYPLVIDPSLVYSTYLGGSGREHGDLGMGIAIDSSGSAYVVGTTDSADFPTTSGAYNRTFGDPRDVFVTKLNPSGSSLIYSTYLGRSGNYAWNMVGIAVDSSGNAYVTGTTNSSMFPVTSGAFNQTFSGNGDGFITKLNPSGSSLVYSTYVGGSDADICTDIAVDSSGSAYVTGYTVSNDFPTTSSAYNRTFGGNVDGFVTKLNPSGSSLMYSTYLGGSGHDYGNDIIVDSSGNAYVTGYTYSDSFPTTSGAYNRVFSGIEDVFITKLNPPGSSLVYSTYLGGWYIDVGHSIAVDSGGNAYVTGYTYSNDFPTTSGAYNRTFGDQGYQDAFVTKLDPSGSSLEYSTYLGGQSVDHGYGIAVDNGGNTYVTGITHSGDFPTTGNAYNQTFSGTGDVFISKLNPAGSSLLYSTYLGSPGEDAGLDIVADNSTNVYVTGYTYSDIFPTTSGAYNRNWGGGGYDAFVAKLTLGPARTVSQVYVFPYGYLPTGTPVTAVFTVNVVGLYPSGGEEQFFTDLDHPNWTYTVIVNGVENIRPVVEGNSLTISGFELSYRPSDVVSVYVTLQGDAPELDSPLTNFTVVKMRTMDRNNDVEPGSVVTVEGQTTAIYPPVTNFTGFPISGTAPLGVFFQDISTNYPSSWNWSFGDGTWYNVTGLIPRNPIHTYYDYGTYTVSLTTANAIGSHTTTKTGYITVTNAITKIGVFRNGVWLLDSNDNFVWDGMPADAVYSFAGMGNTSVYGDWNGDGKTEVGVFINGTWYLDYNGNGIYDGPVIDGTAGFGSVGYNAVVGDWDGTGKDKIGVEKDGFWAIDYNGNYLWDGAVTDRFAGFGQEGDIPVVGDWDGDGKAKIGSFKDGFWAIDYDGNYLWDGAVMDRFTGFGQTGDMPVVGDWDGNGKDKIGVERDGFWATDYNGNYEWEGAVTDRFAGFGQTGDLPVIEDWDGTGKDKIGSFKDGFWAIDYNGNYEWEGAVTDRFTGFGQPGDTPVAGKWASPTPQPFKTITFMPDLTIIPSATVHIPVWGKVIWKNADPLKPHGIAAVDAQGAQYFGGLTGVQIPYNTSYEVTFDTVGTFTYNTIFQPEITGGVIVTN